MLSASQAKTVAEHSNNELHYIIFHRPLHFATHLQRADYGSLSALLMLSGQLHLAFLFFRSVSGNIESHAHPPAPF